MTHAEIVLDRVPFSLVPLDPRWPRALADLADPPKQLWIAGELPALTHAVAIVGTRRADEDAKSFAYELGWRMASAGRVVISGGAAGIDGAAHRGALDAGGLTVAVLATGLKQAFPAAHAGMFAEISRSGALICEQLSRASAAPRWIFLKRNRLVAALASAVVIVQAPVRSGALATARIANSLKRRVFSVPAAPWDPRGSGCLQLLAAGAEICTSAADILSLGRSGVAQGGLPVDDSGSNPNDHDGLPESAQALLRRLRRQASHPDQICTALDMPAAEVQEALLTLVLEGLCRRRADGTYEATAARERVRLKV